MAPPTTHVLRVSRLPAAFLRARPGEGQPTPREVLTAAAAPFGFSGELAVLHSARAALIEMESAAAAEAMLAHHAEVPLSFGGRAVVLEPSTERVQPRPHSEHSAAAVRAECERCVCSLVAQLERREERENAVRRKQRHAAHLAVMGRAFASHSFEKSVCWPHFQRAGLGGCDRSGCKLSHAGPVRFCCMPPRLRTFHERETYPYAHRESSAQKLAVNAALTRHAAAHRVGPRCVVLDGPGGGTARALLASEELGTRAELVHSPNFCTPTYAELGRTASGGTPFLGSLRAFLDSRRCPREGHAQPRVQPNGGSAGVLAASPLFGVVSADYCCSLYAGRHDVELSPVHDLITLFGSQLLGPRAVLAITLARPDADKGRFPHEVRAAVAAAVGEPDAASGDAAAAGETDAAVLCGAVSRLAAHSNFRSELCESFDFEGTFVQIWRLHTAGG